MPQESIAEPKPDTPHVLVVDDVPENRDILRRRLERSGYTVTTAINGKSALTIIAKSDIDLVLLDIMMPEMDGYAVLEHMKANGTLSEIPVVVISAVGDVESIAKCILLGAEDYLPKPFNPIILRARISACLERRALRIQREQYLKDIEYEKHRVDQILSAILPERIADELKASGTVEPRMIESAAVLFSDIVDFTQFCDQIDPNSVFELIESLVYAFESVTSKYAVEKIKTLGDGFMAASGLIGGESNPVLNCAEAAEEWISIAQKLQPELEIRVGIHEGPVVAGILGAKSYTYDLWGDAVNTASRIESLGKSGCVCFSQTARDALPPSYILDGHYDVRAKGKGQLDIYFKSISV